ncbi:MAG: diaminopimelate decarboxylase [Actinobacteria bacterium]|nr:diaminopimelate decarboxylase [Actinomycetota bacterium]
MPAHPAGPRHEPAHLIGAPSKPGGPQDVIALDPAVWPRNAGRGAEGQLEIAGVDVRDVARAQPTPVFLLDEQHVRDAARDYTEAFNAGAQADVYYAGKAFLSARVAQWIHDEGLRIDVCTGGELAVAKAAGIPGPDILFHGNNKSEEELRAALEHGVGRFVVDSRIEIARLAQLAQELDVRPNVLVRVTVGVEAHTHEFIATAHEDQKFGLALADGSALEAVRSVAGLPELELVGLHSHIGSQIFDPSGFEVAARRLVEFMLRLRDERSDGGAIPVTELNLGGGMGIAYTSEDTPLDVRDMAAALTGIVSAACSEAGLPPPRLAVEPGRAIVGPAGITLYTIGTVKDVTLDSGHVRRYLSVDGGMSDNIRTALYDAEYTVTLANRASEAELVLCRIVGKHCESGDIIVRDAWLPQDLVPGDMLAVAGTGAYCRSMASNYNYLPRPGVLACRDGELSTVLRRETVNDMLALDAGIND